MNKVEVKMDEKTVQYYITSLEDLCRNLQEENEQLETNITEVIDLIDMYTDGIKLEAFDCLDLMYKIKEILERGKEL